MTLAGKKIIILLMLLPAMVKAQTALDTAVNFTVKDVHGVTHKLNEYLEQGKLVAVDFFTITCGPCVTYAPEINAAYEHFGCNGGNVVFLGINWGATNEQVLQFGETYGAYYPSVSGLEGNGNHVVADYQVLSYPTVILIEPGGAICEQYIWPPSVAHLDSVVASHGGIAMPCNTGLNKETGSSISTIKVFPNPATEYVNVETKEKSNLSAVLINMLGVAVRQWQISAFQVEVSRLSLKGIEPGFYQLFLKKHGMIIGTTALVISGGNK